MKGAAGSTGRGVVATAVAAAAVDVAPERPWVVLAELKCKADADLLIAMRPNPRFGLTKSTKEGGTGGED